MNIKALTYLVVESTDPRDWAAFGERVIGLSAQPLADGGIALRADERLGRIFAVPGARNRYHASGWEVRNEAEFTAALKIFEAKGVNFDIGTNAEAAQRGALGLARFADPAGNRHELVWGFRSDFSRFTSPAGVPKFVMGDLGMGHTVLPAPNFDETRAFFTDILGLGLSDLMVHRPGGADGPAMRIHFMHVGNPRHHSLALFEGEVPAGCVHFMLEYESMDEVGRAIDRAAAHGAKMTATLGRHVNDGVTSFYCATPGGFSVELGWGGTLIDWSRNTVFESTSVSLWGHDFSLGFK
ncbi:VOC family protein [Acidocella sp. KAb 2-4]|uniref:VOC family protein n=1 Tax=Acidocella sp. KAb 2-4 TaxID=2885158 RepID=UPI001D0894CF|nr:VOC family protein [Acidocella sp. KAb 2-4]MCB5944311.1 VOC family protein [Acidocella sp. KAb 2-4]